MHQRYLLASLFASLLLGCAQAAVSPAQPASPAQAAVPARAPIQDNEPDVTRQVAGLLQQIGHGNPDRANMTERAAAALDAAAASAMGAQLQPCPQPLALSLLERSTKGEDRQYLYRVACGAGSLLAEVDFNKAARINRLALRPEAR